MRRAVSGSFASSGADPPQERQGQTVPLCSTQSGIHLQPEETGHFNRLAIIASEPAPERPERSASRAKTPRPKSYRLLTKPRHLPAIFPAGANRKIAAAGIPDFHDLNGTQ